MNYPSIRIEGAILSPDILDRIEDLPGQKPSDFGFDSSAKVKDEIARAWADAQDYWRIFQRKLETLKPNSPATTETRQQWMVPLLGLLGYQLEYEAKGADLNGKIYSISHRATNRANAPVHIVGYREPAGLDRKPEVANIRMSAHGVVQEFINLNEQVYALVTNGRVLRLLRDSSRLIKLTYLEFDLDRIFTDGLFADFAVLFRLLHVSRLPATNETANESWIERYHLDSLESGARIRDGLSAAVEQAIRDFGNGFLAHPANTALREAVENGSLRPEEYYKHLLRLIYRLLFLMVIEERDLVFPVNAKQTQRETYRKYYSLQRLRLLSERRYLADHRRHDLWLALLANFHLFEANGPGEKLGIAPLAGDLFRPDALGYLVHSTLGNDVLLRCLRSLDLYEHPENRQLIRVNYGALNVEEFGSVYEGLLKYRASWGQDSGNCSLELIPGEDDTQSHYTPDDLVQPLIKHSLDYLIADRLREKNPEAALLDLRVVDIACGSGHILLAAARRIATELAVIRTGEEQPSPTAYRVALRDVIRTCIYGVDLNPLAVELCKVALWLEAHNPGQPLNFLDHHIKCGNAIVGFVRHEELDKGVPDEAFATTPSDDKDIAGLWRKTNKKDRKDIRQMRLGPAVQQQLERRLTQWNALSALPERTPAEIEEKKQRFLAYTNSPEADRLEQIAAIPIAQFYVPKTPENDQSLISDAQFRRYWIDGLVPQGQATAMALSTAREKHFFHWFLEFPDVIARGGFDCILGNPPYLGGTYLSGTYGYPFCHYVKWQYAPAGLSDLVVYFIRRIYRLLRTGGFTAFITTNSIKDGDVRKDGLEQLVAAGATINMAVRAIRWPGRANLSVSLVALYAGSWARKRSLDGKDVPEISTFFESYIDIGPPKQLKANARLMFEGYKPLGDGFFVSEAEREALLQADPRNAEVLRPFINGHEITNFPDQKPSQVIIYFRSWPIEQARQYEGPFALVEQKMPAARASQNRPSNRDRWWVFGEARPALTERLSHLKRCFVTGRYTKFFAFSEAPPDTILSESLKVFTTDRWDLYALVQSTLHEVWARKYSGALETRLRYSPSECFETFAFPESLWISPNHRLGDVGEQYYQHRKSLMLALWLGLTDIYNLFHDRSLSYEKVMKLSGKPTTIAQEGYEGLLRLRSLHCELDIAVRDAYGWHDLDLGHDFQEVETLPEDDRVRYTISASARKEVLGRLLVLNHERAKAEAAAATKTPKRQKKTPADEAMALEMFPTE